MDPITDIVLRYQTLLEGVKEKAARDFAKIALRVGETFMDWLTKLNVGKISELRRRAFLGALRTLQEAVRKSTKGEAQALMSLAEDVGAAAARFEGQMIQEAIIKTDVNVKVPATAPLREAVFQRRMSATGKTLTDFVTDWVDSLPQAAQQLATKAYANGLTIQEVIQGIRGTKAANYQNGLVATTRRQAEAVARTSVQHAASAGREEIMKRNDDIVTGYRFVATLDGRTSAICRSLDGRIFAPGEGPIPPVHINCRSSIAPIVDPALGLDFLDKGATRSSLQGYVPAELTYYDWLKTQSPAFQKEVLGESRAKLLRSGGLTAKQFGALQLDKKFEPRTLDEMKKLEPLAFRKAGL